MTITTKSTVFSIYRSFRRQISLLPSEYLRQFFRIKLADDVRKVLTSSNEQLQQGKLMRVKRDLRKLEAAHAGDHQVYAHVLDVAYGRKGRLRWEIMQPLLSDPKVPPPDRIIPAVEKSRPPVYSPELAALLTSGLSRSTKPLARSALETPPTLPARADPKSEDARLLGPLSKRREVNIRWRFFTQEWKKVYPPLHVEIVEQPPAGADVQPELHTDEISLHRAGIRPVGLQGAGVYEDLVKAAGPILPPRTLTRRERAESGAKQTQNTGSEPPPLPRFIRRRYRELLARTPILQYQPPLPSTSQKGKYVVARASNALDSDTRYAMEKVPEPHESYLAWVGDLGDGTKRRKQK